MHGHNLVLNDWRLQAAGGVRIECMGDGKTLELVAPGSGGTVNIVAQSNCQMGGGKASVIVSDKDSSAIQAAQKTVKIGAGGPVCSAIEMGMDGVTISLTPLVTIKLSQTGIELTAGPNKVTVGVQGITIQGIMLTEKAEAVHQKDQGLSQDTSKGPRKIGAALDTIGT